MLNLFRKKGPAKIELAHMYLWNGRVYLPVQSKTHAGFFWGTGPVLQTEATPAALESLLADACQIGNPGVATPTREQVPRTTPAQQAMGLGSWKKMVQAGVMAAQIEWGRDRITLSFSSPDPNERSEIDYDHPMKYPLSTPLRTLAEAILAEWRGRGLDPAS